MSHIIGYIALWGALLNIGVVLHTAGGFSGKYPRINKTGEWMVNGCFVFAILAALSAGVWLITT